MDLALQLIQSTVPFLRKGREKTEIWQIAELITNYKTENGWQRFKWNEQFWNICFKSICTDRVRREGKRWRLGYSLACISDSSVWDLVQLLLDCDPAFSATREAFSFMLRALKTCLEWKRHKQTTIEHDQTWTGLPTARTSALLKHNGIINKRQHPKKSFDCPSRSLESCPWLLKHTFLYCF